jgi:hypothetical protein
VIDEPIYILRYDNRNVGYVNCREIAQWWAEQREGRGWLKLEPKYFSDEEALKIVNDLMKEKPV